MARIPILNPLLASWLLCWIAYPHRVSYGDDVRPENRTIVQLTPTEEFDIDRPFDSNARSALQSVKFNSDGSKIAGAITGTHGNVVTWDLKDPLSLPFERKIPLAEMATVRWLSSDKKLLCAGSNCAVWSMDMSHIDLLEKELKHDGGRRKTFGISASVADTSENGFIAIGYSADAMIWSINHDPPRLQTVCRQYYYGNAVLFSASGKVLYTGTDRGHFEAWNVEDGQRMAFEQLLKFPKPTKSETVAGTQPGERQYGLRLAGANDVVYLVHRWENLPTGGVFKTWEFRTISISDDTGKLTVKMKPPVRLPESVKIESSSGLAWTTTPNRILLATADSKGKGYLLNGMTGKLVATFHNENNEPFFSVDITADGSFLATGDNHTLRLWKIPAAFSKSE